MRRSKTLARLRNKELVRMCCLGHHIPAYVKHAAHFGFDCIWLDLEHRRWNDGDVQSILAFAHLFDIDIVLRAPTLEKTRLYRYLEDGATGLMIPHVGTPEKARMLVDAVKFPPLGDRGLDGAGLDADFYVHGSDEYLAEANRQTFLLVQIESPQAVANAESIAAVDGVDGLFVGPGDLGLRLRHSSVEMTLEDGIRRVAEACAKHGKAWGLPVPTPEELKRRREQGAQLISHGGEFSAILKMLQESAAAFEGAE